MSADILPSIFFVDTSAKLLIKSRFFEFQKQTVFHIQFTNSFNIQSMQIRGGPGSTALSFTAYGILILLPGSGLGSGGLARAA